MLDRAKNLLQIFKFWLVFVLVWACLVMNVVAMILSTVPMFVALPTSIILGIVGIELIGAIKSNG